MFQKYLYRRAIKAVTNHQPLTVLFETKRPASTVAVARIHRWLILVADYSYRIVYKSGKKLITLMACQGYPCPVQLTTQMKDVERETTKDSLECCTRDDLSRLASKSI